MLTFLYCITHSISVFFTRISTWMNDRMKHKCLCKHMWKARKNLLALSKDSTQVFIIRTESSSTELLEQIQRLFSHEPTTPTSVPHAKPTSLPVKSVSIEELSSIEKQPAKSSSAENISLLTPLIPSGNTFEITDIDLNPDDLFSSNNQIPVNRAINKSTPISHSQD